MKILLTMPVYINNDLHLDFTRQTIESAKSKYDLEILIVNNYCIDEYKEELNKLGKVIESSQNSVPEAWNLGIEYGIKNGFDYIIVSNNDIVFHPLCIDNLVDFAVKHPEFSLWTASEHVDIKTLKDAPLNDLFDDHPHFSCFMLSPQTIKILGEKEKDTGEKIPGYFDETMMMAYFEDGDMHQRLLRQGMKAGKTALSLFYHYGSRTIRTDEEIELMNRKTYEMNRNYFFNKWGFDPHGRVIENDDPIRFEYKKPFNK